MNKKRNATSCFQITFLLFCFDILITFDLYNVVNLESHVN